MIPSFAILPLTSQYLAIAAIAVSLCGCGKGIALYEVSGEVVLPNGAPLKGGSVEFRSLNLPHPYIASGAIAEDGTFRLEKGTLGKGAVPAEYKVIVAADLPGDVDKLTPVEQRRAMEPIARIYRDYQTTPLRFTVTENAAKNHFLIQVHPPVK
jgi:hypothetical protein